MYCKGEACRSIRWETQALRPWDEDAWLVYCMCHYKCLHGTFACRGSTSVSCKTFMGSPPLTSNLPGFPGGWDIRHLHLIASISLGSQCSEDEAIRKQCTILGWNGQSVSCVTYLRASNPGKVFLLVFSPLKKNITLKMGEETWLFFCTWYSSSCRSLFTNCRHVTWEPVFVPEAFL